MWTTCKCGADIDWQSSEFYRCPWCGREWHLEPADLRQDSDDWVAFLIITYKDKGNSAVQKLYRGTKDDCEIVASKMAAVTTSGSREPKEARLAVLPVVKVPDFLKEILGV